MKLYNVTCSRLGRSGDNKTQTGFKTLQSLKKYFGYTLEVGRSWNNKIPYASDIKSIRQFMTALQKSYEEKEAACYDRTMVSVTETEIKKIPTVFAVTFLAERYNQWSANNMGKHQKQFITIKELGNFFENYNLDTRIMDEMIETYVNNEQSDL